MVLCISQLVEIRNAVSGFKLGFYLRITLTACRILYKCSNINSYMTLGDLKTVHERRIAGEGLNVQMTNSNMNIFLFACFVKKEANKYKI